MVLGRSLVLAACMLSATVASAQSLVKDVNPAGADVKVDIADTTSANTSAKATPPAVPAAASPAAASPAAASPAAASPAAASPTVSAPERSNAQPAVTPKNGRGVYKDDQGVRHDPHGKKGVSPYIEAVRRGDEGAMASDFIKAEEAYVAAIAIDAKNPLAHLRRGQALVRAGKLTQAEGVYQEALQLTDRDATLHAMALFVLADLKERQGLRDEAIAAWARYADYVRKEPRAKAYPETPTERDKRLKRYNELVSEGKAVRERIELRVKEVDEANKRKAAKNPNANR